MFVGLIIKSFKLDKTQLVIYIFVLFFWMSNHFINEYKVWYAKEMTMPSNDAHLTWLMFSSIVAFCSGMLLVRYYNSDYGAKKQARLALTRTMVGLNTIGSLMVAVISILEITQDLGVVIYVFLIFSCFTLGMAMSNITLHLTIFDDAHKERNTIKTIIIIGLAPLFANLIATPFKIVVLNEVVRVSNYETYGYLWLLSAITGFIAFVISFFVKDNYHYYEKKQQHYEEVIIKEKKFSNWVKKTHIIEAWYTQMWIVVKIGMIFILGLYLVTEAMGFYMFGDLINSWKSSNHLVWSILFAWFSGIYSFFGIIGLVCLYNFHKKKTDPYKILVLGMSFVLMYTLLQIINATTVKNPYFMLGTYSLAGLGNGIVTNYLLAIVLYLNTVKKSTIETTPVGTFNIMIGVMMTCAILLCASVQYLSYSKIVVFSIASIILLWAIIWTFFERVHLKVIVIDTEGHT